MYTTSGLNDADKFIRRSLTNVKSTYLCIETPCGKAVNCMLHEKKKQKPLQCKREASVSADVVQNYRHRWRCSPVFSKH